MDALGGLFGLAAEALQPTSEPSSSVCTATVPGAAGEAQAALTAQARESFAREAVATAAAVAAAAKRTHEATAEEGHRSKRQKDEALGSSTENGCVGAAGSSTAAMACTSSDILDERILDAPALPPLLVARRERVATGHPHAVLVASGKLSEYSPPSSTLEGLVLVIQSSPAHAVGPAEKKKVVDHATECENLVSNLRWFNVPMKLVGKDGGPLEGPALVKLGLQAHLIDDKGVIVTKGPHELVLEGETQMGFQMGGDRTAAFKLKAGPTVLSKKMRTTFRIRVQPWDEHVRSNHPSLSVLTEPFRLVTKVNRK